MSIRKVSTKDAARTLTRLLRDVVGGQEIVITSRGRPVAVLSPYATYRGTIIARLRKRTARLRGLTLRDTYTVSRRELERRGGR